MTGLVSFDFSPLDFNSKRFLQLSVSLISLAMVMLPFSIFQGIRYQVIYHFSLFSHSVRIVLALVFLLGVASSLFSAYPLKGLQEIGLYALLFCMTMLMVSQHVKYPIKQWLWGISFCLAIYSIGYFFQYILFIEFKPKSWMYSVHGYSNPRAFNHVQGWLIPLMALLPLLTKGGLKRLSYFGLSALYFYMLVTAGRGLPLALVLSFVMSALLFRVQATQLLKVQAKGFLLGGGAYLLLIQFIPWLLGQGIVEESVLHRLDKDNSDRLFLWSTALRLFQDSPWLGGGPQHYIIAGTGFGSPHNIILQWLSEWGGPATLLMVGISIYCGACYLLVLRQKIVSGVVSESSALMQVAIFMSLLTSGIYSQVSGVFITPLSQILMVLVVGCAISFHYQDREYELNELNWLEKLLWPLLLLFLVTAFYWIFYQEFYLGEYELFTPWEKNAPRFWLNGDFTK